MTSFGKMLTAVTAALIAAPGVLAAQTLETEDMVQDDVLVQDQTMMPGMVDLNGVQELRGDDYVVKPFNLPVREFEDMDVYGPDGEQVGEVEGFLGDSMNNVVAVVVETEGFLGLGDEDVVVGLDQLELVGDRLVTALTEEQLEELPKWDD